MSESFDKLEDDINFSDLRERYSNLRELGQGGMGKILVGHDERLNKDVAIKVLNNKLDSRAIVRFQQEAKILSKLRHEYIVKVMDFLLSKSGQFVLIMEFIDGVSLEAELATKEQLSASETIRIGIQLSQALQHAHSQGIIHRDLKPANVMLDAMRNSKILDFGIAKLTAKDDPFGTLTSAGQLIGSPLYMSPEQLKGDAANELTDVYGLGLLIFTLLSGRPPFGGDNIVESLQQRMSAKIPSLESTVENQKLIDGLEVLIGRALDPDPSMRIPNMAEFERELLALQTINQNADVQSSALNLVQAKQTTFIEKLQPILPVMLAVLIGGTFISVLSSRLPSSKKATPVSTTGDITDTRFSALKVPNIPTQARKDIYHSYAGPITNLGLNESSKPEPESSEKERRMKSFEITLTPESKPIEGHEGKFQQELVYRNMLITSEPITISADLAQLKDVSFKGLDFTGNQNLRFSLLQEIPKEKLHILDLTGTKVSDGDLGYLRDQNNLFWLKLNYTPITDQGLESLTQKKLVRLELHGCRGITDKGILTLLKVAPGLRFLRVGETSITREGAVKLQSLKQLIRVDFSGIDIRDEDIISFPHLQRVELSGCQYISDKTVNHFASTNKPRINYLDVSHCDLVTQRAYDNFMKRRPNKKIVWKNRIDSTPGVLDVYEEFDANDSE
jgi:serine/threonine protein kinase